MKILEKNNKIKGRSITWVTSDMSINQNVCNDQTHILWKFGEDITTFLTCNKPKSKVPKPLDSKPFFFLQKYYTNLFTKKHKNQKTICRRCRGKEMKFSLIYFHGKLGKTRRLCNLVCFLHDEIVIYMPHKTNNVLH